MHDSLKENPKATLPVSILSHVMGLCLAFIITLIVTMIIKLIRYKYISFFIYDKYVQYQSNLFILSQKSIHYKNIKEITLHRSILQKIFGLGTIKIKTHANAENAGMKLYDLVNYQEIYNFLMSKIDDYY
jgi:uncharacterized membrane protein YdbT with pleckstrin-like domain